VVDKGHADCVGGAGEQSWRYEHADNCAPGWHAFYYAHRSDHAGCRNEGSCEACYNHFAAVFGKRNTINLRQTAEHLELKSAGCRKIHKWKRNNSGPPGQNREAFNQFDGRRATACGSLACVQCRFRRSRPKDYFFSSGDRIWNYRLKIFFQRLISQPDLIRLDRVLCKLSGSRGCRLGVKTSDLFASVLRLLQFHCAARTVSSMVDYRRMLSAFPLPSNLFLLVASTILSSSPI
jgi:hypothetical protein